MNRVLAASPRLTGQVMRHVVSCQRSLSTSQPLSQERVDISKIKEAQKHFQIDDGTPVYLKGGLVDRVLFGITVTLCVVGLGYSANLIYKLSVPPKN